MLQNNYINTFIQTLESTKIQKKDGSYHETYTEGIQMLFDVFLEHKRFCSNLFFVGNGCHCQPYGGRFYEKRKNERI